MRESRQTFWVGLFVLVGLAAFGVLIVLFGQTGFLMGRADAYVINIRFQSATGIRPGTIVTAGGIPVGRVANVNFVDSADFNQGVNVQIAFDAGHRLHENSTATTTEPGLGEGRPPIVIHPGPADGPVLASGASIGGEISSAVESLVPKAIVSNFDKTATRIAEAAAALTPVLEDLHEVMRPRGAAEVDLPGGPPGNLSSAVARLDSALKHFNDVLGDPEIKSRMKASIDNLYAMTEDGKAVFADMKDTAREVREATVEAKALLERGATSIERIDGHVDRVARALTEDLDLASRFLTKLIAVVEKIDRGEGTIGRLFTDARLYEELVLTFRRLAATTEEFRALVQEWQKRGLKVGL